MTLNPSEAIDRNIVDLVKSAIRAGYRHLDTAEFYHTEEELGTAIKEVIDEGIVKREDLFVTTKIWGEYGLAETKINISLKKLGLDYVDLYAVPSLLTLSHFHLKQRRAFCQAVDFKLMMLIHHSTEQVSRPHSLSQGQ